MALPDNILPARDLRIALVGAPNCGKTSLFNALTGANQRVGNFSGVTVERKTGTAITPKGKRFEILDLPGTHSLRARSPDEEITRDIVLGRRKGEARPDLVLVVADATHLRPGLRLAQELQSSGLPLALIVNMIDIAKARGITIDAAALSAELGIPVIPTTAVRRAGMEMLWSQLDTLTFDAPADATWTEPSARDLRELLRKADTMIAHTVVTPHIPMTWTARIDGFVLNPYLGPVILLGLLFLMFQAVFAGAAPLMDMITALFDGLTAIINNTLPDGLIRSFLADGIIAGVGGVIIFLPQILILFLFILALEDSGYMARAAFLMDRVMSHVGLHGRALIPLISSFACAIPGIMAARVIDDRKDRLTTILIAPLMTCSARIPIYTLLIGAFIPDRQILPGVGLQGFVMFGLYAIGIISALLVALVGRLLFRRGEIPAPLMLDLPDYKLPRPKGILLGLLQRAWAFLRRAGTIILYATIAIWFLSTFPFPPEGATEPAINYSFAAYLGHLLEPILSPVGFNWEICVALIPGMAAREIAVAGLGTVYAVGSTSEVAIGATLAQHWSIATALALIAWYVFAPQCMSTLAVIRRETGNAKYMWYAVAYMFALAYIAAFVTYRVTLAFI